MGWFRIFNMQSSNQLDLLDLNRLRWMVGNLMAISSLMAVRIMEMVDPLWLMLVVGLVITARTLWRR